MENKETADEEVAEQNVAEEKEVDEKKVLSGNDISREEDGERKKNEEIFHAAINVLKNLSRSGLFGSSGRPSFWCIEPSQYCCTTLSWNWGIFVSRDSEQR